VPGPACAPTPQTRYRSRAGTAPDRVPTERRTGCLGLTTTPGLPTFAAARATRMPDITEETWPERSTALAHPAAAATITPPDSSEPRGPPRTGLTSRARYARPRGHGQPVSAPTATTRVLPCRASERSILGSERRANIPRAPWHSHAERDSALHRRGTCPTKAPARRTARRQREEASDPALRWLNHTGAHLQRRRNIRTRPVPDSTIGRPTPHAAGTPCPQGT